MTHQVLKFFARSGQAEKRRPNTLTCCELVHEGIQVQEFR
jgi:hypothetical protein